MLTKIPKIVQASEFRKNLSQYLKNAKNNPVVVSTERGGDSRVVLSADLYNKLIEFYHNSVDARELIKLVEVDDGERISLSELEKHEV